MVQDAASALETRLKQWEQIAFWRHLGIKVVQVRPGYARLSMPFSDPLRSRDPERIHGGAIATLVDASVGAAVATLQQPDDPTWAGQATTDLNVSFLSAARGGTIFGEATIIRQSRTLCFGDVDIRDEAGELLAKGRATYVIIRRPAP
jgi:acyl-CoA thioesterase